MSNFKKATNALHAGHDTNLTEGTRAVPIYQSTSYVFNDTDHAAVPEANTTDPIPPSTAANLFSRMSLVGLFKRV